MRTFLQESAQEIVSQSAQLDQVTVVFPNRRAIIYFRKYLSDLLEKPTFAPKLYTFEQFVSNFSELRVADRLDLIYRLHRVYEVCMEIREPFDQFYFWGDMLLGDFDELDKYRVNAEILFTTIRNLKEIDTRFEALTAEQKQFLTAFWSHVDMKEQGSHDKFLALWSRLGDVYKKFNEHLRSEGLAYEGMIQRQASDRAEELAKANGNSVWFVGFNALTTCEELIIKEFVKHGSAKALWDTDEYYMNDQTQEAGIFLREYKGKSTLASTFAPAAPSNFRKPKSVNYHGVAQQVGQAKVFGLLLKDELIRGCKPEETLVVLPDEKMLLPVLHSIPQEVERYNVTMGFPLAGTPVFNLAEALISLQSSARKGYFNHKPVTSLLNHPYLVASDVGATTSKLREMTTENRISVPAPWLREGNELLAEVFTEVSEGGMIPYLIRCAMKVGEIDSLPELEKEYIFQFIELMNRAHLVIGNTAMDLRGFHRVLRQLVSSVRIPFIGEPLRGLQIMGVLETRNLDFRNVFVLSMNEGAWPALSRGGSFVPYNIRKAFGVPAQEHHDAIYAYHFYRLLQRAENIHFLYSTETDVLGQGEMSRFLRQLEYESGWEIRKRVIYPPVRPTAPGAITVPKSKAVVDKLAHFLSGSPAGRTLSPTALNSYRACRLQFYLRHIARIREPDEIEDEMDAREVGKLIHEVMEKFYTELINRKKSRNVTVTDFNGHEEIVNRIIDNAFRSRYASHHKGEFRFEGRALVVREVALKFVERVLRHDKAYAPFQIIALEKQLTAEVSIDGIANRVALSGNVDRADLKGGVLRIIDYKTGKDKLDMKEDAANLFDRDASSEKAVLQTMLYTYLYAHSGAGADYQLVPGLMSRANLFSDDFEFGLRLQGGHAVNDARDMMPRFETSLKKFLAEIFDDQRSFDQTEDHKVCRFCAYHEICSR